MLFKVIHGAQCVLRSKGVYRQVDIYEYGPKLFAKWGAGFIGLRMNGGTTHPDVTWEHIEGVEYTFDTTLQRCMTLASATSRKVA